MKSLGNFQIILLVFFGVFAVLGVFGFAGLLPLPDRLEEGEIRGDIAIWGTLPQKEFKVALDGYFGGNQNQGFPNETVFFGGFSARFPVFFRAIFRYPDFVSSK